MNLRLLRGGPDYYAVQLDGGEPRLVEISRGQSHLQLFDNLEPGPHEVRRYGGSPVWRSVSSGLPTKGQVLHSELRLGTHASC